MKDLILTAYFFVKNFKICDIKSSNMKDADFLSTTHFGVMYAAAANHVECQNLTTIQSIFFVKSLKNHDFLTHPRMSYRIGSNFEAFFFVKSFKIHDSFENRGFHSIRDQFPPLLAVIFRRMAVGGLQLVTKNCTTPQQYIHYYPSF